MSLFQQPSLLQQVCDINFRYIWISVNLLWKHTTESVLHSHNPFYSSLFVSSRVLHPLELKLRSWYFSPNPPKKTSRWDKFLFVPFGSWKCQNPSAYNTIFCSLVCFPKNSTNIVYKTTFCCSIWFPKMSKTKSIAQESLLSFWLVSFWLVKMANTNILYTSQINKKTKQASYLAKHRCHFLVVCPFGSFNGECKTNFLANEQKEQA